MTTMTAKAKTSGDRSTQLAPVILFGIDSSGKPKAAKFGMKHAGLATKAASQLQLRVLQGDDPKLAEIAGRLPVGKVHATGRMFVPFVRRDLYDKLLAAAPNGGSQGGATAPPSGTGGQTGGKPAGSPPNLPRTWAEIGIGDLVVAFGGADEGWYEAIVAEADGDMLTLRWRDYPRERRTTYHRNRLALLHASAAPSPTSSKPGKPAAAKESASAADNSSNQKGLPLTWDGLDAGHLVLAKADGPWGSWWEAIVNSNTGDALSLRWRNNHANVPPITRSRFELALIRPDAT
jgi:hypothetical protein